MMTMIELLDAMKGRPMMVVTAFMLQMSLLVLSLGKRKAVHSIGEKIESKRRLETALENYGLNK